jgi:hypothetical protein
VGERMKARVITHVPNKVENDFLYYDVVDVAETGNLHATWLYNSLILNEDALSVIKISDSTLINWAYVVEVNFYE